MTRTNALLVTLALMLGVNVYDTIKVLNTSNRVSRQVQQVAQEGQRIGLERRFIIQSCARLNILRVEDNISHFADYRVFRIVLIESRASPPQPGQTAQQAHFEKLFLGQLQEAVQQKTWTPRTDCKKAVSERGPAFRAPHPIPFYKRLPTKTALTLVPTDFQPTAVAAP